ncbi:DUF2339 domain-containing protein [Marilutibacter alkalisoli]|uniref:DUF2339 domain-containing protein n=1 Tax=Marilutibacter alkalisoli TaxID=2591633 RepID=A0A514BPA2_9GAMM|nr:DUF2339 domain-containing protein [Lysobacter alkalisoli]QDH69206.1 DUF2339 domain-containing protein [Lysobacter alkalisoli]
MEGLIVLLVLAVLLVPVLLVVALVLIAGLRSRVAVLENQVASLRTARSTVSDTGATLAKAAAMRPDAPPSVAPAPAPRSPAPEQAAPEQAASEQAAPEQAAPEQPARPAPATPPPAPMPPPLPRAPAAASSPPPVAGPAPVRPGPDPLDVLVRAVKRWFTEGNVPVKVGMLVLFAGVAALLKYASDQGWMSFPIQLRLAGVAAAGLAALVFGWRQRERRRSFGLSLQGGAIGVLLLVVFAAFKLYPLLPPGAAFALSIVLVAGAGVLAVAQNSVALAILGILAGFLAPLWLSTGGGNHVALFGYYAVLNAAIFAIAWWRPWRALNLLGFVFTFGIGTLWGVLRYRSEDFASTEPFLLLFFAFYLLIPILYARRRPAGHRDLVDGCLVFGMPLVAFSLQAGLLEGQRMALAFCALGLAAIYAALAWALRRREHFAALVAPYAVLAVGFATLAVPLALSAQATASVFALEGAALAWLGLRQQRRLPQVAGVLLQLAAAASFMIGYPGAAPTMAVANAGFTGALLIALAGFASAWSYWHAGQRPQSMPYYLWGLAWWCGNGLNEIDRFIAAEQRADVVLMCVAASTALAALFQRRIAAPALAWTVVAGLAAALPLALAQDAAHAHPFAGLGALAWALYAVLGGYALHGMRKQAGPAPGWAHAAWLAAWPLALGLGLHELALRLQLGDGWRIALAALPWLAVAAALQWRPAWVAWPLTQRFGQWRAPLQCGFLLLLAIVFLAGLKLPGNSAPLPWLPLLNPLDLFQVAVLVVVAAGMRATPVGSTLHTWRMPAVAATGFVLVSAITLRATHHWGSVEWGAGMFSSSLVQTALTVVWSMLGVLGWIFGSRRGQRTLWLAGAVLMAVVLAKLVLIDRQHLGNLLGIVSFIAYGLLCTAVGYFAPAPPRSPGSRPDNTGEVA